MRATQHTLLFEAETRAYIRGLCSRKVPEVRIRRTAHGNIFQSMWLSEILFIGLLLWHNLATYFSLPLACYVRTKCSIKRGLSRSTARGDSSEVRIQNSFPLCCKRKTR